MDVEGSTDDLAKRIVDLEAQWNQWKEEKIKFKEEVIKVKGEEERMKNEYKKMKGECLEIRKKFDSVKVKWKEEKEKIRDKYWEVEEGDGKITKLLEMIEASKRDKEKMVEVEAKNLQHAKKIEEFEMEKKAMQNEVSKLNKVKSGEFKKILEEKLLAEAEKKAYVEGIQKITVELMNRNEALKKEEKEMESEMMKTKMEEEKNWKLIQALEREKEEKNSKLVQKMQASERDKERMVAEVSKLQKGKSEEAERSFCAKKILEAEKKRSEDVEAKNSELAKKIAAAEAEKKAYEEDIKKIIAELMNKNEVLEKEKKEMEAKHCRENKEKDAENKRILKELMALEEEVQKMILERGEEIDSQNKQLEIIPQNLLEFDPPVEQARISKGDGRGKKRKCWSPEEHELFLKGIEAFGKGNWKNISKHFVRSRSQTQLASHAQHYYLHRRGDEEKQS